MEFVGCGHALDYHLTTMVVRDILPYTHLTIVLCAIHHGLQEHVVDTLAVLHLGICNFLVQEDFLLMLWAEVLQYVEIMEEVEWFA